MCNIFRPTIICAIFFLSANLSFSQTKNTKVKKNKEMAFPPPPIIEQDRTDQLPRYESDSLSATANKITPKQSVVTFHRFSYEENEALRQFIGFCKIQVDIEDQHNPSSTGYTNVIFFALKFKQEVTPKIEIKRRLDDVLTNKELRKSFLTFFAKISGNNFERLCMIIRPPYYDNMFLAKVSTRQTEILANCILKNFPYIPNSSEIKEDEEPAETQKDAPILTAVEPADYIGGEAAMMKFISKNLIFPKAEAASNEEIDLKILVSIVIEKDGSITQIKLENVTPEMLQYESAIIQCFQKMPKWKPAQQKGLPVKSIKRVPVRIVV